jgi:hypothetical protein
MSLVAAPSDQWTHQFLKVDPISLHALAASLDFETARIDDEAVDAMRLEEARQPKCVIANLIAK